MLANKSLKAKCFSFFWFRTFRYTQYWRRQAYQYLWFKKELRLDFQAFIFSYQHNS